MIRFGIDAYGNPVVTQLDVPPTVYLDHWALRKLSQDQDLSGRFTRAVEKRNGTVVLSWLNVVEFTQVGDGAHGKQAEEFYKANFPRIFFLDSDPFAVIRREDALLAGHAIAPTAPHADIGLLSTLKLNVSGELTIRDLFSTVQQAQLAPSFHRLADTVAERIEALRDSHDQNRDFQRLVARLPSGRPIQRGTRYVLRELARRFLVDRGVKVSRNNAIDLMHAVVPLSYCEFVMLDKHWEVQAGLVRARLKASKLSFPLARVYSEASNGIERFFQDFES